MRIVMVRNETRGTIVGDHVEVANTALTRMIGLLGRHALQLGGGLWIRPSSGVHTVGMKFPIDVIGLDKSLTVIRMWNSLQPYRITAVSWKMHSVVEIPAGQIREAGVQLGDILRVVQ